MKIRFQRWVYGEGYTWSAGGEGEVIGETDTFYKVAIKYKNFWGRKKIRFEWVNKTMSEIIKPVV